MVLFKGRYYIFPSIPESMKVAAIDFITGAPYVEGAWMSKHGGEYYLQYGASGSRFNVYADGVYVGDRPLGPFRLAENNPYSYKPGGFLPGAGHGSTMEDTCGNAWHTATMRICVNHNFERHIGLWPAGWDEDGEGIRYTFEVPANTTAEVRLPDGQTHTLGWGTHQFSSTAE